MRRSLTSVVSIVLPVLVLVACSSSGVPSDLAFEHDNSCGRSFTGVNEAGTAQLSLSPLPGTEREDIPPGLVDLADKTWTGKLKVGSGLRVWPCHDVASDFEEVEVEAIWLATSGTIEIARVLPATSQTGGGGAGGGPFTIVVTDLVLTNGNETIDISEVSLSTDSWGFYGG